MIHVQGLRKTFADPTAGKVVAVAGISLDAAAGEIVGILGANGAGKTTTMRMLATLLVPDEGTATVAGHDIRAASTEVRRSIGYLSASTGLYGRLTPREMLEYVATLQGVAEPGARAAAMIERFDIARFAHVPCDRLSTGMRQKVSIARAVVHDPPVLILDEPTSGLDVLVAEELFVYLEEARQKGKCVLYSTHIMSEASRLCNRLVVIHQGKLHAVGTPDELRQRTNTRFLGEAFLALVKS